MLGYFKREGGPTNGAGAKRPRPVGDASSLSPAAGQQERGREGGGAEPLTIVTWNANGLGVRLSKDWQEFKEFMTTVLPDVCCIQEASVRCIVPRCAARSRSHSRAEALGALGFTPPSSQSLPLVTNLVFAFAKGVVPWRRFFATFLCLMPHDVAECARRKRTDCL